MNHGMNKKKHVRFGPVIRHTVERYINVEYSAMEKADWIFNEITGTLDTAYEKMMLTTLETNYFTGQIDPLEAYCYRDLYPWSGHPFFDTRLLQPVKSLGWQDNGNTVIVFILQDGSAVSWPVEDLLSRGSTLAIDLIRRRPRMHKRMSAWGVHQLPEGVTSDDICAALAWNPSMYMSWQPESWVLVGEELGLDYLRTRTLYPTRLRRAVTSLETLSEVPRMAVIPVTVNKQDQQIETLVEKFKGLDVLPVRNNSSVVMDIV